MLSTQKRYLLFLLGCIPVRILMAIVPLYIDTKYLPYYGLVISLIAISFFVLYFKQLRMDAPEGGGNTWWAQFRILHGLLFFGAAIYLYQQKRIAWIPLFADAILGLVLFIHHHFL